MLQLLIDTKSLVQHTFPLSKPCSLLLSLPSSSRLLPSKKYSPIGPLGWEGGPQVSDTWSGPMKSGLGGGWEAGGAAAVVTCWGEVCVHPAEVQASRVKEYLVHGSKRRNRKLRDRPLNSRFPSLYKLYIWKREDEEQVTGKKSIMLLIDISCQCSVYQSKHQLCHRPIYTSYLESLRERETVVRDKGRERGSWSGLEQEGSTAGMFSMSLESLLMHLRQNLQQVWTLFEFLISDCNELKEMRNINYQRLIVLSCTFAVLVQNVFR